MQHTVEMSHMKTGWFFLQLDICMQVFSAKATTCGPRYTGTTFTLYQNTGVGNIDAETTRIPKCLCHVSYLIVLLKKKINK